MEHIVILGNGISGITAARHIRKLSNKKITVVSAETEYFFSRTALMYIYMGHMKFEHTQPYENWFWKKNKINLKYAKVIQILDTQNTLLFENGDSLSFDKLIIATGSKPNKFGWPGQDGKGVLGLYHKQDLETLENVAPNNEVCKRAVIVGGGLIGIELAEMLRSRDIPVTFLVREQSFWDTVLPPGESQMINRHIKNHHIDLRLNTNLDKILLDKNGVAKAVVIKETQEVIECSVVGLTAGVSPNIDFLKESNIDTKRGVLVDAHLQTNIPTIYAIGDCAEQREAIGNRNTVEAVWYTGRMMGEVVAQTICGRAIKYRPGHWFNSAKFLDIEYQTYGWVFAKPKGHEKHFHWKHRDDTKCITINYHKDSFQFIGINTFGMRMRHEVLDRWLTQKKDVHHVIENLREANFDPEFYSSYENEIQKSFDASTSVNA